MSNLTDFIGGKNSISLNIYDSIAPKNILESLTLKNQVDNYEVISSYTSSTVIDTSNNTFADLSNIYHLGNTDTSAVYLGIVTAGGYSIFLINKLNGAIDVGGFDNSNPAGLISAIYVARNNVVVLMREDFTPQANTTGFTIMGYDVTNKIFTTPGNEVSIRSGVQSTGTAYNDAWTTNGLVLSENLENNNDNILAALAFGCGNYAVNVERYAGIFFNMIDVNSITTVNTDTYANSRTAQINSFSTSWNYLRFNGNGFTDYHYFNFSNGTFTQGSSDISINSGLYGIDGMKVLTTSKPSSAVSYPSKAILLNGELVKDNTIWNTQNKYLTNKLAVGINGVNPPYTGLINPIIDDYQISNFLNGQLDIYSLKSDGSGGYFWRKREFLLIENTNLTGSDLLDNGNTKFIFRKIKKSNFMKFPLIYNCKISGDVTNKNVNLVILDENRTEISKLYFQFEGVYTKYKLKYGLFNTDDKTNEYIFTLQYTSLSSGSGSNDINIIDIIETLEN